MSHSPASQRQLILGTAGHIDHGKTALVQALTGVDTDRLPDEKRRGITIDLGFARLVLPGGLEFGVVDVPGHESFIRNMVAGATGVDVALLVVAADEGVMPQTREHLAILQLLAIPRLIVALTKTDLVEAAWLELVREEVGDVLAATSHHHAPLVAVSARTGAGLDELRGRLAAAGADAHQRERRDLFRLPLDRAFTVRGTGTVVTGTVWSGATAADAALLLLPRNLQVRARGAQVHGQEQAEIAAGARAALALAGLDRNAVERGDTLVAAGGGWRASSCLTVRLTVLPDAPAPLVQRQRVRLHLGTAEVLARVRLLEGAHIEPGGEGWAQLRLESPVVARGGDRFILRRYSPIRTLGGGRVAEVWAPKRRRVAPPLATHLEALLAGDAAGAVAAAVELAGRGGVPGAELAVRTGLPPHIAAAGADAAGVAAVGDQLVPGRVLTTAAATVLTVVDQWHAERPLRPGAPVDAVRGAVDGALVGLADRAIADLVARGELETVGPHLRRPGFVPVPTRDQALALDELSGVYRGAALTPPEVSELASGLRDRTDLDDLLTYLQAEGVLVQLRPGMLAHAGALAEAAARLQRDLPRDRPLAASDFKGPLAVTRKHLIPLLEHLDRVGITRREGDLRSLLPPGG